MAVQWQFILWLENVKHFCLCFPEDLVCVCVAVFFHYCLLENCFTLHSRFVLIWNLACWLSFQHSMSKEFLSFSLALSRSCSKTAFFFCAQPQGRGAVREFLLLLPSLEFMRKELLRILFLRLTASIQSTNQTARLLDFGRLFFFNFCFILSDISNLKYLRKPQSHSFFFSFPNDSRSCRGRSLWHTVLWVIYSSFPIFVFPD